MAEHKLCSIEGCGKPVRRSSGWCDGHHYRWRHYQNPLGGGTRQGKPELFLFDTVLKYNGSDCLIWPYAINKGGYGNIKSNGKTRIVTRIVCEYVSGPPPTIKHQAAHNCGNRICCNPNHLRWATRKENESDKITHGTDQRGERGNGAKLTEKQVREIRELHGNVSYRDLAVKFGISRSAICNVVSRRRWAHIQ